MDPLTRFPNQRSAQLLGRRRFLKSGMHAAAAASGVSLVLPPLSARAADRRGTERPKSLIFVWLAGGPSQLETWDPHPGTAIGGETAAIETRLPGVQIGSDYPAVAEVMDRFSVIRSLTSKEGDHQRGTYYLLTGYRPDPSVTHPSLGAIVTRELPDEKLEIPPHVMLGTAQTFAQGRGGYFGDQFDAYRIDEPGGGLVNIASPVDAARQQRRLSGLEVVGRAFARGRDTDRTRHAATTRSALDMMQSEQLVAFDTADETAEIKAAYGDSKFGRGCLVARRLVETGVRAVQVALDGFDSHVDNFRLHTRQAGMLDPALATLITDLEQRDLLASTAVVVLGEFGRTPRVNPLGGRDHWPTGFSALLAGGGLKAGEVIGATDPTGETTQPTDPVTVEQLYATVLQTLGIDPGFEEYTPIGRPLKLIDGEPIARLLG